MLCQLRDSSDGSAQKPPDTKEPPALQALTPGMPRAALVKLEHPETPALHALTPGMPCVQRR